MSLDLKWVLWRQHIGKSSFLNPERKMLCFSSTPIYNAHTSHTSDSSGHQICGFSHQGILLFSSGHKLDSQLNSKTIYPESVRPHRWRAQSQVQAGACASDQLAIAQRSHNPSLVPSFARIGHGTQKTLYPLLPVLLQRIFQRTHMNIQVKRCLGQSLWEGWGAPADRPPPNTTMWPPTQKPPSSIYLKGF